MTGLMTSRVPRFTPRERRARRRGAEMDRALEKMGQAMIVRWVGREEIKEAISRAASAHVRLGLLPSRKSMRTIALAWLEALVDAEIDRMLARERGGVKR